MATALITGGTVGLGRAFAQRLAGDGWDLVLASRDAAGLEQTAADLKERYGVAVEVIPTDLSQREQTLKLAERVEDPDRPVDLLINNAGFGWHGPLLQPDLAVNDRIIEVMGMAVLILSAAAGRAMKERGRGGIINITSAAALMATGSYAAIKSWATVQTESLANELAGTGVRVLAVQPGWVETEFHQRAGTTANGLPSFLKPVVNIRPEVVVDESLRALAHDTVVCVPTRRWAFCYWLARVMPRSLLRQLGAALTHSRT